MWFSTLILRNIFRRPLRSFLTVVAIAIAIGSVVSLVGVARGFERSFVELYEKLDVDMLVIAKGQAKAGALPETLGESIRKLPGVQDVIPGLVDAYSLRELGVPTVIVNGWVPDTLAFKHLNMLHGDTLHKGDTKKVLLGTVLSNNIGKGVGDKFELISNEEFEVVGIFESFSVFDNGSIIMPLEELQRIQDKEGKVTGYSIIFTPEGKKRMKEIRKEIETLMPNIQALPIREHLDNLPELQIAKAMAWLTSAIALVIGLFGMMNTMVMSVHERTREIGILRAVGWRPRRVLGMVLFEAVVLSQLGAVAGVLGSVAILAVLTRFPLVNGIIEGKLNVTLAAYGFVIAAAVGLVGGILPARRAASLMPTAALRQE
jgi:putative ABC transport system permease protein